MNKFVAYITVAFLAVGAFTAPALAGEFRRVACDDQNVLADIIGQFDYSSLESIAKIESGESVSLAGCEVYDPAVTAVPLMDHRADIAFMTCDDGPCVVPILHEKLKGVPKYTDGGVMDHAFPTDMFDEIFIIDVTTGMPIMAYVEPEASDSSVMVADVATDTN